MASTLNPEPNNSFQSYLHSEIATKFSFNEVEKSEVKNIIKELHLNPAVAMMEFHQLY